MPKMLPALNTVRSQIRKKLAFSPLPKLIPFYSRIFFPGLDIVDIEISNCNLTCAMCPRVELHGPSNKKQGMMSLDIFQRVINKFVNERVPFGILWLGNWGEPLLNPVFPEMVKYAKSKLQGTKILAFSNLTHLQDPNKIIESRLDDIEISLSGMSQEIYSRNHIGGDVETVLNNIKKLAHAKKRLNSKIGLTIKFHDYIYNKKDAVLAKKFCEDNGIIFKLWRCYIPCVELNIEFAKKREDLAFYYSQFINLEDEQRHMKTLDNHRNCLMKTKMITIDFDGQLYRCCGVYDEKYFLGSFFDVPIRDIWTMNSKICELCEKTPMSWRS